MPDPGEAVTVCTFRVCERKGDCRTRTGSGDQYLLCRLEQHILLKAFTEELSHKRASKRSLSALAQAKDTQED